MANKKKDGVRKAKPRKTVAAVIKELLAESGMTRSQLALELELSESAIYGYLRGNSPKTLEVRQRFLEWSKGRIKINDWPLPMKGHDG